jgi:hypothetical protein
VGIGDEAALACRDALGCWGSIKAYRNFGDPAFSDDDPELLAAIGPSLGSALRHGIDGAALARSGRGAKETHALERAVDGRWVKIEVAALDGHDGGQIAVVLRGAAPAETFELLCRDYALTTRERQVVAALIAGDDTRTMT